MVRSLTPVFPDRMQYDILYCLTTSYIQQAALPQASDAKKTVSWRIDQLYVI